MAFPIILFIFSIVIFLCFIEEYLGKYKFSAYVFVCVGMILFAGLREVGLDRDSETYEERFYSSEATSLVIFIEPSFTLMCIIARNIWNNIHTLFLLYALLGVTLKFIAIKRLSPCLFVPVAIYIANFYVLHDLTQIRAGVASGFFLMSLKPLSENSKKRAALYMAAAVMFHYSALILFPLLLLSNNALSRKWKIALAAIPVAGVLMYVMNFDLLLTLPIPYLQDKVESYRKLSDYGYYERSDLLTPFIFFKLCFYYYCLWFSDTIKEFIPSINIILKIMGLSIITYYAFSYVTILGQRFSELYGTVEILLYSSVIYTIMPRYAGKASALLVASIMAFYSYIWWDLLYF